MLNSSLLNAFVCLQVLSWRSLPSHPSPPSCLHTCGVHPIRKRRSTRALRDCWARERYRYALYTACSGCTCTQHLRHARQAGLSQSSICASSSCRPALDICKYAYVGKHSTNVSSLSLHAGSASAIRVMRNMQLSSDMRFVLLCVPNVCPAVSLAYIMLPGAVQPR